jgi:uncharacterized protein YjeT (DUF2065 family)
MPRWPTYFFFAYIGALLLLAAFQPPHADTLLNAGASLLFVLVGCFMATTPRQWRDWFASGQVATVFRDRIETMSPSLVRAIGVLLVLIAGGKFLGFLAPLFSR